MNRPRLLITRPADEAARTAEAAEQAGFEAVLAPLLLMEPVGATPPSARPDAILFTSPRAPQRLAAIAPALLGCPAYTVGARTAQAARIAGFAVGGEGEGDGNAALQLAAAQGNRVILHPRGEDHIALAVPADITLTALTVYRARAVEALPADIISQLASGEILATLLVSPRTARLFADLVLQAGLHRSSLHLVALSANVAKGAGPDWGGMAVAQSPTLAQAFAAAHRLWQGSGHA